VTRIETQLSNHNQTLLQAKNRVGLARVAMNRVLGIDTTSPTEVVKPEIKVEPAEVDVALRTQEAYAKRPEIQAGVASIELNEKNVKYQRTEIMPSMNANAVYDYNFRPTGFSTVNASWIATFTLNIPIWDGGVTKAKVQQAHAELQSSRDGLGKLKLNVGSEVDAAALNLNEATQRVATTAQGVDLAKESLRLAQVRYDAGIATLVEVTDAQSALTLANFNYVQAEYDYVLAVAELQRATGVQPELDSLEFECSIP
jgi:outer membrane protein